MNNDINMKCYTDSNTNTNHHHHHLRCRAHNIDKLPFYLAIGDLNAQQLRFRLRKITRIWHILILIFFIFYAVRKNN